MPTLYYSNGLQSTVTVPITKDYESVDLTDFTRFVINFVGRDTTHNFTIDTTTAPGAITGSSSGILTINLTEAEAAQDSYILRIKGYSSTYPNGFTFFDPCCAPLLTLKVCGTPVEVVEGTGIYFEVELGEGEFATTGLMVGVIAAQEGPLTISGSVPGDTELLGFYGVYLEEAYDDFYEEFINTFIFLSNNTSPGSEIHDALTVGDVLRVAVKGTDMWVGVYSGGTTTWLGGGDPEAGTTPTITSLPANDWYAFTRLYKSGS